MQNWYNGSTGKNTQKGKQSKKCYTFYVWVPSSGWAIFSIPVYTYICQYIYSVYQGHTFCNKHHMAVRVQLYCIALSMPLKPEWNSQLAKEVIASWIIWAVFHGQSENLKTIGQLMGWFKSRKRPIPRPTILGLGWWSKFEILRYSGLPSPGGSVCSEDINLIPRPCSSTYEPWYWPAANLPHRITINLELFLSSQK